MTNTERPNYKLLLAGRSLWLFIGRAMPVTVLFLITILYSRHLTYEAYGRFQSVWIYANIINIFIAFGITSVILSSDLSFLLSFIKGHLAKIAGLYVLLWIIVFAIFYEYGKNLNSSTRYLVILFTIFQNITTIAEALMVKIQKEKIVSGINFIYSLLFFSWHYYVLVTGFDLDLLITGIVVITAVKFLVQLILKNKTARVAQPVKDDGFLKHWSYLGVNDALGVIARWLDKLFLLYLLTSADFAVYFNGSFEIPLFALLTGVISSIMLIEISAHIAVKEKVVELFKESFRILSVIVFPLFWFLFFFRSELFSIVFKGKYDASLPVFLISIFILPLRINSYTGILQCYAKGSKIMLGSFFDICIAVLLMFILYPVMGTKGIALSIVVSTYCQAFYYLWQSAKVMGTGISSLIPLKELVAKFIILLVFFLLLSMAFSGTNEWARLFAGIISTFIAVLIGFYFYFVKKRPVIYGSSQENQL